MPLSTFGVATAVTPSVIETYFSHYFNRRPLKQKPTAHISYHEGLKLIRQFLDYSSKHTVEDLQSFTAQWVPAPSWVRTQDVEVPPQFLKRSANLLRAQLGSNGLEKVGGEKWWQWRRSESPLHAEWIEMKKDYNERKRLGVKCDRCILYVHGGAYYFGSVDEHRYQMQRHARKLKARVLSPRYRLAPQFPFPCGLYDCIATYFYLLEHFKPNEVLFAGDSAGGGMIISMLVTLRDQGCPLPAGVLLLSPWVDLTHSFPSTGTDGIGDYIPAHGFHHKPSMAWPPPAQTEVKAKKLERKFTHPVEQAFDVIELPADLDTTVMTPKPSKDDLRAEPEVHEQSLPPANLNQLPGFGSKLELEIDNKLVLIQEQIQMYARNELLTHPLVSPVQQPSLGGLPPMLIQVGGAEFLRDEQIYLAHKAANPKAYPPSATVLNEYDPERTILNRYPPTDIQLQVWEDLCHVPHTLSFTRPAKYMYRSVAQFGAWALARAQNKSIEILDDDAVSIISDGDEHENVEAVEGGDQAAAQGKGEYGSIGPEGVTSTQFKLMSIGAVGKAGEELPPFKNHMIRQRVDRHGVIYPLPHRSEIASLHIDPATIGEIKPGPVRKWLAKRAENEQKFTSEYKKLVKKRAKDAKDGYDPPEDGENPPPTALYNRRRRGVAAEEKKKGKSWGLAMWSGWGSSHDESTIHREEKVLQDKAEEETLVERAGSIATTTFSKDDNGSIRKNNADTVSAADGASSLLVPGTDGDGDDKGKRRRSSASLLPSPWSKKDEARTKSPYRKVRDAGQISNNRDPLPTSVAGSNGGSALPTNSESRRSSVASSKLHFTPRPATAGAVLVADRTGGSAAQSPTLQGAAPTTADTSKGQDAVKVPGTESTFLNPDSSRPHNGIVAYPFKLRQNDGRASPNPSMMTLDSNEHSDREPIGVNAHVADRATGLATTKVDGVHAERMQEPETPIAAEHGTKPDTALQGNIGQAQSISTERPVSLDGNQTSFSQFRFTEQDTVGSLESDTPTAAGDSTPPTFNSRQGRFESRDSRLGFLGPDGMPTSAWGSQESDMSSDHAAKSAPFKIRNPVYDSRVSTNTESPASIPEQQTDLNKGAPFKMRHTIYDPKIAPVTDSACAEDFPPVPSLIARSGGAVKADGAVDAAHQDANTAVLTPPSDYSRALPPTPQPISATSFSKPAALNESAVKDEPRHQPPPANTSHPVALGSQPNKKQLDPDGPPPPPPPKDDVRIVPGGQGSSAASNGSVAKRKVVAPISKVSTTSAINSDAPPMIGNLSFETASPISPIERPPLETFVTASEGKDLKSAQADGGKF